MLTHIKESLITVSFEPQTSTGTYIEKSPDISREVFGTLSFHVLETGYTTVHDHGDPAVCLRSDQPSDRLPHLAYGRYDGCEPGTIAEPYVVVTFQGTKLRGRLGLWDPDEYGQLQGLVREIQPFAYPSTCHTEEDGALG